MRLLVLLAMTAPVFGNPKMEFARGVLESARGGDGTRRFEKALEEDPEAWPLVQKVATLAERSGRSEEALSRYAVFARAHPERLEAQVAYADLLGKEDGGKAAEVLEAAARQFPRSIGVRRRLFRNYESRGLREKSLELFAEATQIHDPNGVKFALELARNLFARDDQEVQLRLDRLLEQAMQVYASSPELAMTASEHYRTTGRLDQAVEVLARHAEAAPTSLDLRVRWGVLLLAANRDDEGREVLEAVLKIDPRRWLAHQTLAKWYRKQEQPDRARYHAAERLKIHGGDPGDFEALAQEWLDAEQPRPARILLEKGVFDFPEDADLAALLAVATLRDPEVRPRASARFREAERLSGPDGPASRPEFQMAFADDLMAAGEWEAAEQRLRQAIQSFPPEANRETAAALRLLAKLWESQGRNEAAATSLRQRADRLLVPASK
ncbi:tetratricopeptide (TPR) repeat protein [Haloferula luteola]|uniref:Tetratricopeptide (TPR) repeat protein n=1 Tax=Haloferula luteola TaxID=595692 RepID=A0A840VF98_9BACT|nr:hypothetical protein [Haloferula luteola]MBB5352499.1 tetratricopeptide (TPR) repeat protein [Haloferula luteola]